MIEASELTIAIVSFNSHEVICRCLGDLLRSREYKAMVVDNASTDQSAQRLEQEFPFLDVIRAESNLGYGRAANLAIRNCKTQFLLLLNPDMMATVETIRKLLLGMTDAPADTVVFAPAVEKKDYLQKGLMAREWVIGAAMLFNLELLQQVGLFDENIFLFAEETDLCKRIRNAGKQIILDSNVYIEHLYRQSSAPNQQVEDLKNWHVAWSNLYFYTKHGMAHGKKNPYRLLSLYLLKSIIATNKQKRAQYVARMKGTLAFLRGEKAFQEDGRPQNAF